MQPNVENSGTRELHGGVSEITYGTSAAKYTLSCTAKYST